MDVKMAPARPCREPEGVRTWHWSAAAPLARFWRLAPVRRASTWQGRAPDWAHASSMPSFSGRSSPPRSPFASGTRRRSRGCGRSYSTPISASTRAPSTRRLPVRVVDIDEDSLKAVGQWPWPRTVLADLVDKLAAGGAAAIGFDIVFPEPDRMSPANALRFWPKSAAVRDFARGDRQAPVKRPGLCRGDRQGAGCARFHRRAARHLAPRDRRRASLMAATTRSCSRPITPAPPRA